MNANPWKYKEDNKIKAQKQIKYMDENFTNEMYLHWLNKEK